MMEYKFKGTPGPWRVGKIGKSKTSISGSNWHEFAKVITKMEYATEHSSQGLANAHLISAAPELLEALLAVKRCFPSDILSDMMNEDYELIEAAIHKALNITT